MLHVLGRLSRIYILSRTVPFLIAGHILFMQIAFLIATNITEFALKSGPVWPDQLDRLRQPCIVSRALSEDSPFVRRYSVLVECHCVLEGSCSHELRWHFVPEDDTTVLAKNPVVLQENHFHVEGSGFVHLLEPYNASRYPNSNIHNAR
jgi:hypothetical protein